MSQDQDIFQHPPSIALDELLRRQDIWRGHAHHFVGRPSGLATGHPDIDASLLHRGWPRGALIEICQAAYQAEWFLLKSALLANPGFTVLLNPPSQPFVQALLKNGLDLDRLIVVDASSRSQFLGCYTELARAASCGIVVAWQPREALTYTDLRRCALAVNGAGGLYWVIRPGAAQQQSSPASLRIFCKLVPDGIELTIFKQKGWLKQSGRPIVLASPSDWSGFSKHGASELASSQPIGGLGAGTSNQSRP